MAATSGGDGGLEELTIALPEEPASLEAANAAAGNQYANYVMRNVIETLVTRDAATSEIVPGLATSWEQTDSTTWVFALREGVTFHDGSPFNADAAAAALSYAVDPENALAALDFTGSPLSFAATSEFELEVTTEEPDPILPTRMTMVAVSSAEQLEDDPASYTDTPIGTGAYRLGAWDRGEGLTLERNDDWWGGSTGLPSTIRVLFRPEGEVRAAMMEQGEADITLSLTAEQCARAPQCITAPIQALRILKIDQINQTLLADDRIREAIAVGIDRELINASMFAGDLTLETIVTPQALGFSEVENPWTYDPDRARELVSEAEADGVDISIPITVVYRLEHFAGVDELAEVLASSLNDIGLNAAIDGREVGVWADSWVANNAEEGGIPEDRAYIYPHLTGNELMDMAFPSQLYLRCNSESSTYCDEDLSAQVAAASAAAGDERSRLFAQLWEGAYRDVALLPLSQLVEHYAVSERLTWTPRFDQLILIDEILT